MPPPTEGDVSRRGRILGSDMNRLISRTVVFAIVVGLLAVVYAGLVFVLSGLLALDGEVAVRGSTLAVVAIFYPVFKEVRDRVDRRINRSQYDGERVAEGS